MDKRDTLTGLAPRNTFLQLVEQATSRRQVFSVAIVDLDNFDEINLSLGHDAGDRVLATVGEYLGELAEAEGWLAGRTGGDEFSLLLPKYTLEQAFLRMEALRQQLTSPEFFAKLGNLDGIETFGVGIGLASFPRDARNAGALLRMALEAVYSAKESGRNCVALPSKEEMVLKSCHYTTTQLRRLKELAERLGEKESVLLREALDDLLGKYDLQRQSRATATTAQGG